jgi:hypothetical protein
MEGTVVELVKVIKDYLAEIPVEWVSGLFRGSRKCTCGQFLRVLN